MIKPLNKKELLERTRRHAARFREEVKKSMVTAIVAAFGLIIALVWKDVITELVDKLTSISPLQGALFKALVVTFVSVLGMLLVTWLFSPKSPEEPKKEDSDED